MPEHDAAKMIGGYASGTLTEDERRILFETALRDQDVFDVLAGDQALKELLDDPGMRQRLIDGMGPAFAGSAGGWLSRAGVWLKRPTHLALAGSLATALLVSVVVLEVYRQGAPPPPGVVPSGSLPKADGPAKEVSPGARQQVAEPDRALRSKKPSTPAKTALQRPGGWRVTQSFSAPSQQGPARSLFFTGREDREVGSGDVAREERGVSPLEAPGQIRDRRLRRSEQSVRAVAPLGLRYRVLDRQASAAELRIEVNQTGYLYVLEHRSGGEERLLFPLQASDMPESRTAESQARVQPGSSYAVALGARLAILKDEGPYRIVAILSRRPLTDLTADSTRSVDRRLVDEARRTRPHETWVTEQVPGEGGAMYVVNPTVTPEATMAVTLTFEPR